MKLNRISGAGMGNSLFGKLIFSYIIVIVIVILTLGVLSYWFFSRQFKREVQKVHQKTLEQVTDLFKFQIIEPVTLSFMELSTEYNSNSNALLHFNDPLEGNHYRIYTTCEYLRKTVSNYSNVISAIHVYYKKQNLVISSAAGLSYLNQSRPHYKKLDWIASINSSPDGFHWTGSREVLFNIVPQNGFFSFLRTSPIVASEADCQGIFAIDVSESLISKIIENTIPSQSQNTFIVNRQGKIIAHPRQEQLYRMLGGETHIRRVLASKNNYDSFVSDVDHVPSMVTSASLPYSDWKVISITPIHQFYRSTGFIRQLLMLLCILAIIVGLAISYLLSRQIYNPLAIIIQKLKQLSDSQNSNAPIENEYLFINQFLDSLAARIKSLEATEPVLKDNFITGLLYHHFPSKQELSKKLKSLDLNFNFPYYNVLLFQSDGNSLKNLTPEENQAIQYDLMPELAANFPDNLKLIKVDLPDRKTGLIIGATAPEPEYIKRIARLIGSYLNSRQIAVTITAGSWTRSLPEIHNSFNEATTLFKYHYFYPQLSLITGAAFLNRELNLELFPDSIVNEFSEGLRLRNLKQIENSLRSFVKLAQAGNYSADHCHHELLEIVWSFSVYIKDMQYQLSEDEKASLQNLFSGTNSIDDFLAWIIDFVKRVFQWSEIRANNRNYQIVEEAIAYISGHLDSPELSLEWVAGHIKLSPSYFSKIFKEATGVAFTTYVSNLKLEKARDLLFDTDLTIQEIALKAGFHAPAYFIKQFKARFNYTPSEYRRQFPTRKASL
jgi:two-component system response regulator YesN